MSHKSGNFFASVSVGGETHKVNLIVNSFVVLLLQLRVLSAHLVLVQLNDLVLETTAIG